MTQKTAIFIPGFGAGDKWPAIYLPFLNRLKCFNEIHVLFDENRCLQDDISTISQKSATYIKEKTHADELYLIGYSMGGLQCLDIVTNNEEIRNITKSISTIAAPLYGANITSTILKKYPSIRDMQKNSRYLHDLHIKYKRIKEAPPVLNIQAGLDCVIRSADSHIIGNEYISTIKTATHMSILYYPRTAYEVYGFNTYKIMEQNYLNIDPLIRFNKI